jgi:hypothetical protein
LLFSKGNKAVAVTNMGDRIAEDDHIPFMIAFQYHGTSVLASNKKTVSAHLFYPASRKEKKYERAAPPIKLSIEMLDKLKMKNYST